MALQDQLYQLSARDLQGPLLVPFAYAAEVTLGVPGNVVIVPFVGTLHPIDKIVLLNSWGVVGTPGGASQMYSARIMWLPTAIFSVVIDAAKFPAGGAGLSQSHGNVFDRLLPPRPDLQVTVDFTGSDAHTAFASISGWYLPRGNVTGV